MDVEFSGDLLEILAGADILGSIKKPDVRFDFSLYVDAVGLEAACSGGGS